MKKKVLFLALMVLTICAFAACGKKDDAEKTEASKTEAKTEAPKKTEAPATEAPKTEAPATEAPKTEAPATEEDEEDYTTGDASLDNPRNQDEIGENEILIVSFGTSYNDSRRLNIGGIEEAVEKAFPDWSVRRAFTSTIIIKHVKDRDGEVIDNIDEALERAVKNNVKKLVVQPTHLMKGIEYEELMDAVAKYSDSFEKIVVGEPLLSSDEDFEKVAKIVSDDLKDENNEKTAICFMGHGTEHQSNACYSKMQETFRGMGLNNFYVGTVEAEPSFQDVIDEVKAEGKYENVILKPLMVVAGDHANNDMAGDEDDSWMSLFADEGFEVEAIITGLGMMPEIQEIYVEHINAAMEQIKD